MKKKQWGTKLLILAGIAAILLLAWALEAGAASPVPYLSHLSIRF
jgi:hypothetical protein